MFAVFHLYAQEKEGREEEEDDDEKEEDDQEEEDDEEEEADEEEEEVSLFIFSLRLHWVQTVEL